MKEDKIGKYKHHYYARYKSGKVIEVYRLHADVVLSILLPKLKKQFEDKRVKKDPRLGYTISNKLILQYGEKVYAG